MEKWVNGTLLEKTIKEKGYTTEEVARGADVDVSTVYRAYDGHSSLGSANKIARFVKMTKEEALAIFFPWYVA